MTTRLISVARANKMLPLVRSIAQSIADTWSILIQKRDLLEHIEKGHAVQAPIGTTVESLKMELNHLIDKTNDYIREVESLGCYVEEFNRGIINFPSLCGGRKIFLCWSLQDEHVGYWHELDESFNDRCPITKKNCSQFLMEAPHEAKANT